MFSRSNPAGAPLIVIAGGGIGGLSLALKLHAAGIHEITIVEKSRFINPEVGAGLNVLPSAMNVLSELGLLSAVTGAGVAPSTQTYFTAQGLPICATARGLVLAPSGLPQVAIHRGKLHSILYGAVVERLGKSCMLRGAKVVGYRQDEEGVTVNVVDNTTDQPLPSLHAHVLVGADGIMSAIRKQVLGRDEGLPQASGVTLYRGMVKAPKFLDGVTFCSAGTSLHKLVIYPIAEVPVDDADGDAEPKQILNIVVEVPDISSHLEGSQPKKVDCDQVLRRLDDGPGGRFDLPFVDHRELLRQSQNLFEWTMWDRDPIFKWVDGRVVLMGDAAHPTYPLGSCGASMAMVDARELVALLTKHGIQGSSSMREVSAALTEFQEARIAPTHAVQTSCREMLPEKVMDEVALKVKPGSKSVPDSFQDRVRSGLAKMQGAAAAQAPHESSDPNSVTPPINQHLLRGLQPLARVFATSASSLHPEIAAYFDRCVRIVGTFSKLRSRPSPSCAIVVDRVETKYLKWADKYQRFGTAHMVLNIFDGKLEEALKDLDSSLELFLAGIGIHPAFRLRNVGSKEVGGKSSVVRQYCMDCKELQCHVYEEILVDDLLAQQAFYDDVAKISDGLRKA